MPYNPSNDNRFVSRNSDGSNSKTEILWGGYIDVRIDDTLKEDFNVWWEANSSDVWSWLIDCTIKGLKFGLSWDAENDCFVASLNGQGFVGDARRFSLTARADRPDKAYALLAFKHYVLLDQDWGNFKPSGKKKMDFG